MTREKLEGLLSTLSAHRAWRELDEVQALANLHQKPQSAKSSVPCDVVFLSIAEGLQRAGLKASGIFKGAAS